MSSVLEAPAVAGGGDTLTLELAAALLPLTAGRYRLTQDINPKP